MFNHRGINLITRGTKQSADSGRRAPKTFPTPSQGCIDELYKSMLFELQPSGMATTMPNRQSGEMVGLR